MSDPVQKIVTPIRLEYTLIPGQARSRFLEGIREGRLIGQRCPQCRKVYVPVNGACTTCGVAAGEDVELADTGTVTTFCVVNIPFEGQSVEVPYVAAAILLDGADITFFHIIQEIPARDVRMGLRVKAVWAPPEQRQPTLETIRYFKPSGDPDASFDEYKEHL